jgi:2'-5' RNA ligase
VRTAPTRVGGNDRRGAGYSDRGATALRTAIIVPVAVPRVVVEWRERTCPDRPSRGVPPHVTILFPFAPAEAIDDVLVDDIRGLVAAFPAFRFELSGTKRFPSVLYLPPTPAAPFVDLIDAFVARYPGYPPYGGEFETVVPHVTAAQGDAAVLDAAELAVEQELPVTATASEVVLLEEVAAGGMAWRTAARLPLDHRIPVDPPR